MSDFIVSDTEDNSPEVIRKKRSGFEKQVTMIAGIDRHGKKVLFRPKVKRTVKTNGITRSIMDIDDYLSWLSKQGVVKCYFHNTKYDIGNLFADRLDDLNMTMVGNRLIRAQWRNVTFLDSFNIWPMGLAKVGDAIGLKKLKMDAHNPDYVYRDCEIVRKAMQFAEGFCCEYGVDLPSTLGTMCVRIWQAIGGQNWFCSMKEVKEAYYGGRVELFATGGIGEILYTDINSLYPSCMTQLYPTGCYEWLGFEDSAKCINYLKKASNPAFGAIKVKLEIPKCRIAPLPVQREDLSIFYPYGIIEGVYTIHEVRNAVLHGARIKEIKMVWGSVTGEYYYKEFVEKFYQLRKDAEDEGTKLFLKLLLNNLYGQLGMSGSVTKSLHLTKHVMKDENGMAVLDENGEVILTKAGVPYGKKLLAECQMPLPSHANYLHAAYVTSYARMELQKYLRMIPADDLIYCDTDSIFFKAKGYVSPFPLNNDLGLMKKEAEVTYCDVQAPKFYKLSYKQGAHTRTVVKAKGVPNRPIADHKDNHEKAMELLEKGKAEKNPALTAEGETLLKTVKMLPMSFLENKTVTFQMPFGMRESIRWMDKIASQGVNHKSRMLSVWRDVEKRVVTSYSKKTLRDGIFYPMKVKDGDCKKHII